ncbi:hypothetical protein [Arthrobacter sp. ISL-95]|uniref:hypothetical protein n=1 Tax=Arthrobacter sp. ISL-95 TaxID=2819116 RepID=UPI001BEA9E8E|nr:hypothetical protein [Arthrobacter sp. ISL-95]MBT2587945.1 hypothetical protein [Arthrobacter sp. ISL-95]
MAEPLGTVNEVAARVGESITATEDVALANSMLKEASAYVRLYGLPWVSPEAAPDIAKTIAVAAAARGYQNPSGLKMERGDAVTLDVDTDYRKGAALTAGEIKMIQMAANTRGRIISVPLTNPERFVATSESWRYPGGSPEYLFMDAEPRPW